MGWDPRRRLGHREEQRPRFSLYVESERLRAVNPVKAKTRHYTRLFTSH